MSSRQGIFLLVLFFIISQGNAHLIRHIEQFIRAVEHVEAQNPGTGPLDVVRGLRHVGGYGTTLAQHFLGTLKDINIKVSTLDTGFYDFFSIAHKVTEDGEEDGVLLAQDGTTVALEPLLLGIEVGLYAKMNAQHSGLYALTLARDLGLSFLAFHNGLIPRRQGPNGCWNNVSAPEVFTLSETPSLATEALLNGGVDGAVLGSELSASAHHTFTLSGLLKQYYLYDLGQEGLDAAPHLISALRRDNFRELVTPALLQKEVLQALQLHWALIGDAPVADVESIVSKGVQDFIQSYMNCPAIIPRCMWDASPYRGTPTQLGQPLSYLYIHHTYEPSQPCVTFEQCAADMRAMQQFHQDGNGWDDIGYSFVAGSDGNLYEGRGWFWQGAHTAGYNSKGYGVAIIGDFTTSLPSQRTLELVRHQLSTCAVSSGHLVPDYTVHGHRQLVNTLCPGDALYRHIQTWPHFKKVED